MRSQVLAVSPVPSPQERTAHALNVASFSGGFNRFNGGVCQAPPSFLTEQCDLPLPHATEIREGRKESPFSFPSEEELKS